MSVPGPARQASTSSSKSASAGDKSTTSEALYSFRLLSALRSDDSAAVQPFLDELQKSSGDERERRTGQLLGMAVRIASAPIIQQVITSPAVTDPNVPVSTSSPATALHVASENGRVDAVRLLLEHPNINDAIRDEQGRTPLECAANAEVSSAIEDARTTLQLRYMAQLAGYTASPLNSLEESNAMVKFLEGPRTDVINLNALDEKSGTSLLHEACRRRDLRLVELAMKRGADAFVRDKRGKRVMEGDKHADERIKVFLRQYNNQDNIVQSRSDGRPPDLRGFLSKWVNYRSGWRTRWFVLENGVLSYYRNREDEHMACRGSIAAAVATLHPSSDGSRFEVHSKAHSSVPKMIVKSSHRAEIARWIQALKLNIDYYGQAEHASTTSLNASPPKRATSFSSNAPAPSVARGPAGSQLELPPTDHFISPALQRSTTALSSLSITHPRRTSSPARSTGGEDNGDSMSILEAAEKDSLLAGDDLRQHSAGVPHDAEFDMSVLNIKAQIDLASQLIESLAQQSAPTQASASGADSPQRAIKEALQQSLATLSTMVTRQNLMTQDRERYYISRVQREVEARRLWEENMLTVAKQQAEVDEQLNQAARVNEKKRKALRQARGVLAGLRGTSGLPQSPSAEEPSSGKLAEIDAALKSPPVSGALVSTPGASISNMQEIEQAHQAVADADSDSDDEADEFFDAIEQNNIVNLSMHESIANPDNQRAGTPLTASAQEKQLTAPTPGSTKIVDLLARPSLQPYLHVRNKLPIDDDKRPSVSLWSILKSSVGKDLTKISFPVSFNECTSMLQRMAEDMEYDACLTVAASEQDSSRRIAFVAAFAMSNYSSTIGRIAKPFNPLLSQSFEYAIPNRYRYISEQVSHHPPASACYCEAPTWKYYGEVDAQNKFQGRSFEIRPTGVAHAELVIPKKWVGEGQSYPDAGSEYPADHVIEHYSWKKVTTNVSNFIMGTPIIDHYGDLVVSETCTLTFKPRGWRGANAFEIRGTVSDPEGNSIWDIAGRWDTQLIARRSGSDSPLNVDTQFGDSQKEYLLLWRNSEKPKAPFNLTPYAITLNDIPSGLEQYLCPTDCRLRTDQRAFENAEYDRAQGLKTANEEKQRNTRKLRAEGKLPPHEPRWFSATTDSDTQEKLWEPRRDDKGEVLFWSRREGAGKVGEWEGVDTIFATD